MCLLRIYFRKIISWLAQYWEQLQVENVGVATTWDENREEEENEACLPEVSSGPFLSRVKRDAVGMNTRRLIGGNFIT